MHKVSGLGLKFTGRNTWTAALYMKSSLICEVPVAWADQMKFDRQQRCPKEFLVFFTKAEKAEEFMRKESAIVAMATAHDAKEVPRRFKEFTKLYRVKPIKRGEEPRSVICGFIDVVTLDKLERQSHSNH
jgi:hypothetical protein